MYVTKETLKTLRRKKQFTQEELAEKMGLRRETINKMETGQLKVSPRVQLWLLKHYGPELAEITETETMAGEAEQPYHAGVPFYYEPVSAALLQQVQTRAEPAFWLKGSLFPGATFGAAAGEKYPFQGTEPGDFLVFRETPATGVDDQVPYLAYTINNTLYTGYFNLNPEAGPVFHCTPMAENPPATLALNSIARLYRLCGVVKRF